MHVFVIFSVKMHLTVNVRRNLPSFNTDTGRHRKIENGQKSSFCHTVVSKWYVALHSDNNLCYIFRLLRFL